METISLLAGPHPPFSFHALPMSGIVPNMRKLLPILLLLGMVTFGVLMGFGADFNKGQDAYEKGDYATALREWQPFAEQGDALAQHNLGWMYFLGDGVSQDDEAAVKWLTLSAEQGNASAQHSLGVMYKNGHGVPQDYIYAHMWGNLGASSGDEEARRFRDSVAKSMSRADIATAQKLARECIEKKYKEC